MNTLSYETFCNIYLDQPNEEGYESYKRVMNQISSIIQPVVDRCEDVSQLEIEKTLSLKKYTEIELRGHLKSVSSILTRFSPYSENDENLLKLKEVERVFFENEHIHEEYKRKLAKIVSHIDKSPYRRKVLASEAMKIKNSIISDFFSEDRPLRTVRQILSMEDSGFYSVIDEALKERASK